MCAACRSPGRAVARPLIRGYQLVLSPFIGQQCRYAPTCSAYADEAIERHGLWAGGWMTLARLLRCNPWGGSGYDPVPEERGARYTPWTPWRGAVWRTAAKPPPA